MQKTAIIVFIREPRYSPLFVIHLPQPREAGFNKQILIDATVDFYRHVGYDKVSVSISNNHGLETVIEVVQDPVKNLIPEVLNWSFYSCYEVE